MENPNATTRAYWRERQRIWRAANPDKARQTNHRWRAANPEKVRESDRRWYAAHKLPSCKPGKRHAWEDDRCRRCRVERRAGHLRKDKP